MHLSEEMDSDLLRLWGLVAELSEQLNNNRAVTAALQAQAGQVKGQAVHSGNGFVLRRFNTDLSKEVFESELERMNAGLLLENQGLLHENKQLGSLLKEYEQTLETVMAKFRSQAHAAQQHELTLTRHYETLLLNRESGSLNQDLALSSSNAESLSRLARLLRMTMRSLGGEEPEDESSSYTDEEEEQEDHGGVYPPHHLPSNYREGGYTGSPPPLEDWALAREIEIVRLENENEELRRLLSIDTSISSLPTENGELVKEWGKSPRIEGTTRRGILAGNRGRGSAFRGRGAYTGPGWVPEPGSGVSVSQMGQGMGHVQGIGLVQGMGPGQVPGQPVIGMGMGVGVGRKAATSAASYFKEFPT